MITEEKLKELQKLADDATPGPWSRSAGRPVGVCTQASYSSLNPSRNFFNADGDKVIGHFVGVCLGPETSINWEECWRDMAFIAACREAVPELIAEVRRLNQEIFDLKHPGWNGSGK